VQLVGTDALADTERGELAIGRLLREDFLQQSALGNDAFCPLEKTYWMLKVILSFADHLAEALQRAVPLERVLGSEVLEQIGRMKEWPPEATPSRARELLARLATVCRDLS
jgi:V/A-type H+/Na+-transporting ATPase subunit A